LYSRAREKYTFIHKQRVKRARNEKIVGINYVQSVGINYVQSAVLPSV